MKTTFIIISIIIIAIVIIFIILGLMSRSGQAPGMVDGKLSKCSEKPNCVCSEHKEDASHYIAPMVISNKTANESFVAVKKVILKMGGTLVDESDHYLAATFSSALFGFVDDLEIRIDSDKQLLHLRSASRVGHGDRGVNKKRVELLKMLFAKAIQLK